MNSANGRSSALGQLRGLFRRISGVIAECRYAQRRMSALRTAPDRYAREPDAAPDTYAEFLYRTSGVLMHEPSARRRQRGALYPRLAAG
jgi:hypothetical protein